MAISTDHLRAKILISLLLLVATTPLLRGQCCPYLDTVEILPASPAVSDSVQIRTVISTPNISVKIYDSLWVSDSVIYIEACFGSRLMPAISTYTDTFSVGLLSAGNYSVNLAGKISNDTVQCVPVDSNTTWSSFQVSPEIGLPDTRIQEPSIAVYPNPATTTHTLTVRNTEPTKLHIRLHELSGRIVKEIYSGRSEAGQQTFEVNLEELASGVYIYSVNTEDQTHHLKILKH